MPRRVKVFFDGGWRPATGMETAVVVRGQEYVRRDLGPGTSMEAEWLALLDAIRIMTELGLDDAVLLGDSLAAIARARHPAAGLGPVRLRHIKRTQNLAGIALARLHER